MLTSISANSLSYASWQHNTGVQSLCVRSLLLFGAETCATTEQPEALLIQCDVRMLRYLWESNGKMEFQIMK